MFVPLCIVSGLSIRIPKDSQNKSISLQLSLKSTSSVWNVSYFEAPRATLRVNKSHIPSLSQNNAVGVVCGWNTGRQSFKKINFGKKALTYLTYSNMLNILWLLLEVILHVSSGRVKSSGVGQSKIKMSSTDQKIFKKKFYDHPSLR